MNIKNTVTQKEIDELIKTAEIDVRTLFNKCTLVTVQLKNGFILTESSACVDPENYDEEIGEKICIERIKNKLWELEGYKLQDKLYKEGQKVDLTEEELEATREVTTGKKIVNKLVGMAENNEQRIVGERTNGKTIELAMQLREEILNLPECKLYGIKRCKKGNIFLTREEAIPTRIIKNKLEKINLELEKEYEKCKGKGASGILDMLTYAKEELEELLEEN